jgi:hypothetical protein
MAGRISNLERRIDMILQWSQRPVGRAHARLLAAALIVIWGGFVLSGAVDASPGQQVSERSIKEHVAKIYERIALYSEADVNGDGEIDFEERTGFLTAALLDDPYSLIECFPYSGPFQGSELELLDAYNLVRGLTYRRGFELQTQQALTEAEQSSASEEQLQELKQRHHSASLQATEVVLQAQETLLDRMATVPHRDAVAKVIQFINTVQKKEQMLKELALKAETVQQKIYQLEAEGRSAEADELRDLLKKIQQKSGSH